MAGQQEPPEDTSAGHTPAPSSSPHPHRRVLCFDVSSDNPNPAPNPAQAKNTLLPLKGPACRPAAPISASCGQQSKKETPSSQSPGTSKLRAIKPAILRGSRTLDGKTRPEVPKDADKKMPSEAPKMKRATETSHCPSSGVSEKGTKTESSSTNKDAAPPVTAKRKSECRRKSHQSEKTEDEGSRSTHNIKSAGLGQRMTSISTGSKKPAEERSRAEKSESVQKCKEAWTEKRCSSQPSLCLTANKENEVEQSRSEQPLAGSVSQEESSPAAISIAAPAMQGGSSKAPSMTSPLTKQAAEMLQGIQGQNPAATPTKKMALGSPRLPLPRTPGSGCHPEEPPDSLRTPIRQKPSRDGDGIPRHLPPHTTPDIPTCSPASETGSESSINMAAHTLMILSRAAIARTGTPLKDSVHQQGVVGPTTPKGKKRKPVDPVASPNSKKETQHSGSAACKKAKVSLMFLRTSHGPPHCCTGSFGVCLLSFLINQRYVAVLCNFSRLSILFCRNRRRCWILFLITWMWTSSCHHCIMMSEAGGKRTLKRGHYSVNNPSHGLQYTGYMWWPSIGFYFRL